MTIDLTKNWKNITSELVDIKQIQNNTTGFLLIVDLPTGITPNSDEGAAVYEKLKFASLENRVENYNVWARIKHNDDDSKIFKLPALTFSIGGGSGVGTAQVEEVPTFGDLPSAGNPNVIYLTLDTNKLYRWGGTVYVEVSSSLALGETSQSAYRGDRGKNAYDHSLIIGNPHGTAVDKLLIEDVNTGARRSASHYKALNAKGGKYYENCILTIFGKELEGQLETIVYPVGVSQRFITTNTVLNAPITVPYAGRVYFCANDEETGDWFPWNIVLENHLLTTQRNTAQVALTQGGEIPLGINPYNRFGGANSCRLVENHVFLERGKSYEFLLLSQLYRGGGASESITLELELSLDNVNFVPTGKTLTEPNMQANTVRVSSSPIKINPTDIGTADNDRWARVVVTTPVTAISAIARIEVLEV